MREQTMVYRGCKIHTIVRSGEDGILQAVCTVEPTTKSAGERITPRNAVFEFQASEMLDPEAAALESAATDIRQWVDFRFEQHDA